MADITSLTITRYANNTWMYQDNTMPAEKPAGASFYDGIVNGDLVTFTTDNGGILYNSISYDIINYVDSLDAGNNFTPTSARALLIFLKGINFFGESSGSGSGGATTFIELTDTPAFYFGYGGQIVKVKDDETGLEFLEVIIPQSSVELNDMPSSINPGQVLIGNPAGTAYQQYPISFLNDPPILFKERQIISKGYTWQTILGVPQPVANTQNLLQVGGIVMGWVSNDPETIDATWYWMDSGRYKGGDPRLLSSYVRSYKSMAFETDPDYEG